MQKSMFGVIALVILFATLCYGIWAAGPRVLYELDVLTFPELQTPASTEPINEEEMWEAVKGRNSGPM